MSRSAAPSVVLCAILLSALAVDGNVNPGRKVLQLVTGTGASTAAASETERNINTAIDSHATVAHGGSAANLAASPKTPAGPSKTDHGTAASSGTAQASQAKTGAAINTAASGGKPSAKPAAAPGKAAPAKAAPAKAPPAKGPPAKTGANIPKAVAVAPKGMQGAGEASGTALNAQAATSAAIGQKVAAASEQASRGL